ncbi:cell division protein ZapA [Paenalkalicoccus suaedae]|uniref:Cell division protein ZapA n=1 Tax=Paenalkalicoccus suaedae TaxID=2592382 RepID=A0A859FGQ5_9BACI|nr:cell division protein ZapA [Paenalkalicoccus suaedae]QKS71998.1 cell division protein ZapA [Paenalkalicoccus suaedae]
MDQGSDKIKTVVTIYNQQYTVVGNERSEHVQEAATFINDKMKELKRSNPSLTGTQLAVLAALNISNDYIALKRANEKDED